MNWMFFEVINQCCGFITIDELMLEAWTLCWIKYFLWWQGERGPLGPPGLQGETGIGLPGAKVSVKIFVLLDLYI